MGLSGLAPARGWIGLRECFGALRLLAAGLPLAAAVRRGSEERMAPILMTALTAGFALVPLVLASGAPGNEIQSPMAQVILGGLITSTFLNLVVVPVLYLRRGTVPR